MGAERSSKKAGFSWFCFQAYKHTLRHTSSTFNMIWDASGTCRRRKESDQSPEPEMIRTDPSTAGGKEEGGKKKSIIFPTQWNPCHAFSKSFVIKDHIKISNVPEYWKKSCQSGECPVSMKNEVRSLKKWITTFFGIMNYFHQSRHVPGLVQWYVKFKRQRHFHEMTNLK